MLPSTFRPQKLTDFIGPARAQAAFLQRLLAAAQPAGDPLKILILGRPGIGKSSLAEYFVSLTGATKWSTSTYNGTAFKIEQVEQLARTLGCREMFGSYRVIRVEEVDAVPTVAQIRFLTLSDDLPPHTAIICTSNCKVEHLEERFQRRFQVIQLEGPSDAEILDLLQTRWPEIPLPDARMISCMAGGNLGQALQDATTALIAATPLQAAA